MVATATGSNSQILIAKESAYGVIPNAADFVKVPFKSCGLDGSQNLIEDDNLGNGREKLAPTLGRKSVSGDMSIPVDLRSFGHWLTALLGQTEVNNNVTIQAAPLEPDFLQFANAQGTVEIDGEEAVIMGASLALNNDLQTVESIRADNKISDIDSGMFAATGSVVVRFKDKSLLNKAIAGTPVALQFSYINSATEKLEVNIFEGYLSKPSKQIDGPGGIELSFDFQGAKNKAEGKMVEVELTNDVSGY